MVGVSPWLFSSSGIGTVISDIKVLADSFSSCVFSHVNCLSNVTAHALAQLCDACSDSIPCNVTSDCLRETLCNDISSLINKGQHSLSPKKKFSLLYHYNHAVEIEIYGQSKKLGPFSLTLEIVA